VKNQNLTFSSGIERLGQHVRYDEIG
jgi:hypothetical protein